MDIKQKIEENYILGCIKYKGQCALYLMPIAYWILNYSKYDPGYNPAEWDFVFRDNILIVDDIDKFMKTIEVDKVNLKEFASFSSIKLVFYIDFDIKLFISSFIDIDVEEYLPNGNWIGRYDDPVKYISGQCDGALVQLFR